MKNGLTGPSVEPLASIHDGIDDNGNNTGMCETLLRGRKGKLKVMGREVQDVPKEDSTGWGGRSPGRRSADTWPAGSREAVARHLVPPG